MLRFFGARRTAAFLNTLPRRTLLPLAAAVFALFAMMGFITDILAGGMLPWALLVSNVVVSGILGVGYGYTALGPVWRLAIVGVCHVLYVSLVTSVFGDSRAPAGPDEVRSRLMLDGYGIIVCMTASYTMFLRFIGNEGARHLEARAEMRLAAEIHAILVPPVRRTLGDYECFAFSAASGEVGGDLVDVVGALPGSPPGWIGYIADVSGHGVSSGVLMGMTKSAARMRLRGFGSIATLLHDLNEVLFDLKRPSMFVTFAGVRFDGDDTMEFAVAGNLPILHVRADGEVVEVTTPQIPLGMFENYAFVSGRLACGPGDLLALVTDGLTEVFDRKDVEYGLDRLKGYLASHAREPLDAIARGLLAEIHLHGPQLDDQTLLLIRRRAH